MAKTFTHNTKKKTTFYKERNEEKRLQFKSDLKAIDPACIVYIEEAGIDNRLYREYARAPKGQKIVANVCGKKRERIRIIGGLKEGKFIAALLWSEKTAKDWGIIHECILQNFMSY